MAPRTRRTLADDIVRTLKAEIRAEAYNLLNRSNFNLPGFTLGAADFGVDLTEHIQFVIDALKGRMSTGRIPQ